MQLADTNIKNTLKRLSLVARGSSIGPKYAYSSFSPHQTRQFWDRKSDQDKTVVNRKGLSEELQGLRRHRAAHNDEDEEAYKVKNLQDDGEHGAMFRRLAELSENTSRVGSTGRASVKESLAYQHKLPRKAYTTNEECVEMEKRENWEHANKITKSDKDITATTSGAVAVAATAKAKSALLAAACTNRHSSSGSASSGARLADARVRSTQYASAKAAMDNVVSNMTATEREAYRAELRARFQSPTGSSSGHAGAGGVGGSSNIVTGLASLANERIDAAIAAGAFKKISRGSTVRIERDHNASSPFIDTTEYLMNRMVQRQAIVPPWIEKQQEIASSATRFRARLRADWRRHAARTIASGGGTLDKQMERANLYALAEARINPQSVHGQPKKWLTTQQQKEQQEQANEQVSQTKLSGELNIESRLDASSLWTGSIADDSKSTVEPRDENNKSALGFNMSGTDQLPISAERQFQYNENSDQKIEEALPEPFRDPTWEATERSYHVLQIDTLNSLTRTYNLQAPDIAKKPYFSLERELRACYAEVASQLPEDIRARALAPNAKMGKKWDGGGEMARQRGGNFIERMGGGTVPVWEDRKPKYGLKEWWRDLMAGIRG